MLKIHLTAAAAIALASSAAGAAATIVDTGTNAGPAGYYALFSGQSLAGQFTLTQNVTVDEVQGWILADASNSVGASIYTDSGGLPGTALYTSSFTPSVMPPLADQWSGASGLTWNLTPGTYWVVFSSSSGTALDRMANNAPSPLPGATGNGSSFSGPYNLGIGIRIFGDVSAVPEPATWAMMLLGFGAIGFAMRRRKSVPASIKAHAS